MRVRWDRNVVALFDERTGNKIRLGLGRYTKASKPELVDIKITDYCPFGCAFCYQDSTVNGLHAHYGDLATVINRLAAAKVFEVAIGGGEPTMHPQFIQFMEVLRIRGVVPNFTTKNHTWVKQHWTQIKPLIGAFAYSAETVAELNRAMVHFEDIPKDRINIHYVMGLGGPGDFYDFMEHAHYHGVRVTLLGYKTVGRGDQVEHGGYDWWIGAIRALINAGVCPTFSIDTPLAEQYDERLRAIGIPKYMYHTREGAFSMYIDAVAMKMGASSFENLDQLVPFDDKWRERYKQL